MITHIVFFRFKDGILDEKIGEMEERLGRLPSLIGEIRKYEFGRNLFPSERAYDFALVSSFDSLEALEKYRTHPEHLKVLKLINETCDHTRTADIRTAG